MTDIINIGGWLMISALPICALIRVWHICARLARGSLVPRRGRHGSPVAKGYVGIVMLLVAALAPLVLVVAIVLPIRWGHGSGVGAGMLLGIGLVYALAALLIVWFVSELLISRGFAPKSPRVEAVS
jgi:hypothetical protein